MQFNDNAWNHPLTPKPRPDFRDVKVGGMGVPTMGTDVDHFHQCVGKPSSVLPAAGQWPAAAFEVRAMTASYQVNLHAELLRAFDKAVFFLLERPYDG